MPLMKPRERGGQDSIASAAPAGHSAPIPMPSSARNRNKTAKVGEKPARKLQSEYQRMDIISGAFRPIRSAIHPAAVAPTRRIQRLITAATVPSAVNGNFGTFPLEKGGPLENLAAEDLAAEDWQPISHCRAWQTVRVIVHLELLRPLRSRRSCRVVVAGVSLPSSYFLTFKKPAWVRSSRWPALVNKPIRLWACPALAVPLTTAAVYMVARSHPCGQDSHKGKPALVT